MAAKTPAKLSKYKPEYCQKLQEHMAAGYSFESFAGVAGVCKQTIYTWLDTHDEFKEAYGIAKMKCLLHWEKIGIDNAVNTSESWEGGSKSKSLNASWTFNMKNRFQWKDKQPDEVDRTVINLAGLSEEELKALVREGMPELFKDEKKGKK